MIYITESEPKKLSGLSSLFIAFKYNADIVAAIKSSDKYVFDKKTFTWEVPLTSLAYLLDTLTYIDDITLKLLKDDIQKELLYPKLTHQYPPFEHQVEGITYGLQHENWLLLDSPGMGKTLQMIYLAEELKEQKGLEHCLIICGINTLKANWKKEIQKYSTQSCRILGEKISKKGRVSYGSVKERAAELLSDDLPFFIITNVESLRNEEMISALKKAESKIGMIVIDEIHKCVAGDTLITTDKGMYSIRDIVDNKLQVKVLSLDCEKNKLLFCDINDYKKIPVYSNIIEICLEDKESKSIYSLKCTPDHEILTANRGYVRVDDLSDSDDIIISDITN